MRDARGAYVVFGDWGTTRLRLDLFQGDQRLGRAEGPGIGALAASPADTLLAALEPWRTRHRLERVFLCGMAGSRSGLVEAPYVETPAGVEDWAEQAAEVFVDDLAVRVAPGVAGVAPSGGPDVMRGEETQIFGALTLDRELATGDRWFVLPGTHSKWCNVRDGRITRLQTYPTGELFAVLSTRSSLLMGAETAESEPDHAAGCDAGIARSREGRLLGTLFETRAAQLRETRSGAWAAGFLSGLLIGSEVADAATSLGASQVTLIGADDLVQRYRTVLRAFAVSSRVLNAETTVLAGLGMIAATHPSRTP